VGASLGAYKMVLMRGRYGHQQLDSPRQRGVAWQGASSDDLQLTAYPHSVAYQLRPHEMAEALVRYLCACRALPA
jgi:hypothetical protein